MVGQNGISASSSTALLTRAERFLLFPPRDGMSRHLLGKRKSHSQESMSLWSAMSSRMDDSFLATWAHDD